MDCAIRYVVLYHFDAKDHVFCHSKHPQRPLHTTTYLSTQILSSPMSRACQYWSSLLIYWKFSIATASLVVDAG